MRVDLDAKVHTSDGEDAGSIERVVIDPHANDVTHFVVDSGGFLGRHILVPRDEIERAAVDGDAIRLGLTKTELERLPTFREDDYLPPPTGWELPADLPYPYRGVVWPAGAMPGLMHPITAPASPGATYTATGTGAPASTTSATSDSGGASQRAEPDQRALGKGASVIDCNGEAIGVVDDVRFDSATGDLRGFVLRVGGMFRTLLGGGETIELDRQAIKRVDTESVYLRIDKETLERTARAAGARGGT